MPYGDRFNAWSAPACRIWDHLYHRLPITLRIKAISIRPGYLFKAVNIRAGTGGSKVEKQIQSETTTWNWGCFLTLKSQKPNSKNSGSSDGRLNLVAVADIIRCESKGIILACIYYRKKITASKLLGIWRNLPVSVLFQDPSFAFVNLNHIKSI